MRFIVVPGASLTATEHLVVESPLPATRRNWTLRGGLGWLGLLGGLAAGGCGVGPDPYLGTVDPSGFDVMVRFQPSQADASRDPTKSCLVPRRGGGGSSGLDNQQWIYLGGLTTTQLDITNAADPTKALPPSVYMLNGCNAPEGHKDSESYDPRVNNYKSDRQFPVVSTGFVP